MSIFLYRLGGTIGRHRGLFVGALDAAAGSPRRQRVDARRPLRRLLLDPRHRVQQGQDLLADRFGQTGTSGQILFTATAGKITDTANARRRGHWSRRRRGPRRDPQQPADRRHPDDQPRTSTATLAAALHLPRCRRTQTLAAVQEARRHRRPSGRSPPRSAATPTRARPTRARSRSCSACWSRS